MFATGVPHVFASPQVPWIAASASVDIDGDGIRDSIRVETGDPVHRLDPDSCGPSGACGNRIEGHFRAVVTLSRSRRQVVSKLFLHRRGETLWFWNAESGANPLYVADYNNDGLIDFNLGQFTNNTKWEYMLFTVQRNGQVRRLAPHAPAIFVSPGNQASTPGVEPIPGGFRFRDFGNAGAQPGWTSFSCLWRATAKRFDCAEAYEGE